MFIFGHLGIGSKLATPWSEGLPKRALLLGTLLPDLIDKPVYYTLKLTTHRSGAELGLISGTRTFGHTAALLFVVAFLAAGRKSKLLAALVLGMATHLLLDNLGDRLAGAPMDSLSALLFPMLGVRFPVIPFSSMSEHLGTIAQPFILGAEIIGAGILAWDYWKSSHQGEILAFFRDRRLLRKRNRRSRTRAPYED